MIDDTRKRAMDYLEALHAKAPDTPNIDVGDAFARHFDADTDVKCWALHALGIKLWGEIRTDAQVEPTNRRSVRRLFGDRVRQVRIKWFDVREEAEITQMIVESRRQSTGHAMRVRDLTKIRNAMRAFPGVTAGEAARLAGVKLEKLRYSDEQAI